MTTFTTSQMMSYVVPLRGASRHDSARWHHQQTVRVFASSLFPWRRSAMTTNVVRYFAIGFTFLVAIGPGDAVAGAAQEGRLVVLQPEVSTRDKPGTSPPPENAKGSQVAKNKPNASRGSFEAEGMGF